MRKQGAGTVAAKRRFVNAYSYLCYNSGMAEERVTIERERGLLPESERGDMLEARGESAQSDEEQAEGARGDESPPSNVVDLAAHREARAAQEAVPVTTKDPLLASVEEVMSDGLADVYRALPASKQQLFRTRGEAAAEKITAMIRSGKPRAYKAGKLIDGWLRLIPNVNTYFLRQETKLKVDEVMKLRASADRDDLRLAA